jgi:hypothetical protein
MAGAQAVIDLTNSPSFEDRAMLEFFETSGRNLLAAEAASRRPARTGQAPCGVRGGHERDGTDDPIRELRFSTFRAGDIAEVIQQSRCFAVAYLLEEEATALWREPTVKLQLRKC